MIVGRADELAELDALLADLLAGHGRALLVQGEAGIGKTTLLNALVERSRDSATTLRARGVESEAEIAFSALSDLLRPVVDDLVALPEPQAVALAAALSLGPPQPGDRLGVCVATLGVLRAAADRHKILVVVDDLQWLDAPSRECILYASRRLEGSVAVVLAVREAEGLSPELDDLPSLRLGGLTDDISMELLGQMAPDLAPHVAATLVEAGAGNPLALVELLTALSNEQRAGRVGLDLPLAPEGRLHDAFIRRIDGLPTEARIALLVAATYQGDDLTTISTACARAATDVALLAMAEAEGFVRIDHGRATFVHPLIRRAAFHGATAEERRDAHRALADALQGEARAWHLAAAAVVPDEAVAAELERAAGAAAARRGFASAAAALEKAARLSPSREAFARRMLAAGEAAAAAGLPARSLAMLEEASHTSTDGHLRGRAEHLRGLMMLWGGEAAAAGELLVGEAELVTSEDAPQAAAMLADAAMASTSTGDCHRALALAERAVGLLGDGGDPPARAHVLAVLSWALTLRGQTILARSALEEAERWSGAIDPLSPAARSLLIAMNARLPTGEFERTRDESLALCERAREAGALGALPVSLAVAADAAYRLGDWALADATSKEALQAAEEVGQRNWAGLALTIRARLAAAQGREQASRRAARGALRIAEAMGLESGRAFAHAAVGFLELGLDRIDAAITEFERVERVVSETGLEEPTLIPWAPDLVEAYVRAGRGEDAVRVIETLERQAAGAGTAPAHAALARARGLVVDDFTTAFTEALTQDDRRPMPFERARTLLCFGRRLHRARRRAHARERLREALTGFERLGAATWAARTRSELQAAGARRRAAHDESLTRQELRVAAAASRGASNREIGAELYLAPKTIEFHLRNIYRKLGVRSRAELAARLAREEILEPRSEG
jgi:ATP/maltotriose-dependent transcriptional regulator MalT